jgi:heat shock protein HslJ
MKWSITCAVLFAAAYGGGPVRSQAEHAGSPQGRSIPSILVGDWIVTKIEDRPMVGGRKLTIRISLDGEVSGEGGCNELGTQASVSGGGITFRPVISTKRDCKADIVRQEQHLTWALQNSRSWIFDAAPGLLKLRAHDGKPLISMSRL